MESDILDDLDVNSKPPEEHLVQEVFVDGLFGQYKYKLHVTSPTERTPPVILLYGDNGSGKTTILNLLWHLLSPAHNKGHRSALGATPFKSFQVRLGNGNIIAARKIGNLVGDFEIVVTQEDKEEIRKLYQCDPTGRVVDRDQPSLFFGDQDPASIVEEMRRSGVRDVDLSPTVWRFLATGGSVKDPVIEYLQQLQAQPYLLADDRQIYGDTLPQVSTRTVSRARLTDTEPEELEGRKSALARELSTALGRTNEFFRQHIFSGAAQGSQGADAIYLDVLERLSRSDYSEEIGESSHQANETSFEEVFSRMAELEQRTSRYSEYGLVPRLEAAPFLDVLRKVPPKGRRLVASVLSPYLDGQRARLDSLADAEALIRTFVDRLNVFLVHKEVNFTLRRGLRIVTQDGSPLRPENLSSGERQLLLLLCNALLARTGTRLFIIDEPEISLNAKWQRNLVQALLDCVEASGVQFILATHSIEIVTRHKRYLAQLEVE